jgi:hypothetical protein
MAKKEAGAGRGFVNPQRTDERDEDYVTPAKRSAMEQQVKTDKDMAASEAAYNKVVGKKKGGITAKYMSFTKTGKPAGMRNVMASGGSVSSRADGIAQQGKTRGKMV